MPREEKGTDELASISLPRVMISGTHHGVGISTIVLGLMVKLRSLGVAVAGARVGPGLIESTHHRRVCGRFSHIIDSWILDRSQVIETFARGVSGAEFCIVEGDRGLFDSHPQDASLMREVDLARLLMIPVILVIDARRIRENAEQLLGSFFQSHRELQIGGIIANFVENRTQDTELREIVESKWTLRYIGGIAESVPERFPGKASVILNRNSSLLTRNQLLRLGDLVEQRLNLDLVKQIAGQAGLLKLSKTVIGGRKRMTRIAVADDQAFHLLIQDNLDLLRRAGAELVTFSPIVDQALPPSTKGIYLPGAVLDAYAEDLSYNESMMQSIRNFVIQGGALYAEGSAFAYLAEKLIMADGSIVRMTGLLPGVAVSSESRNFNTEYLELKASGASLFSKSSPTFRGFRERIWALNTEVEMPPVFELGDSHFSGADAGKTSYHPVLAVSPWPKVFITDCNLHWGSATKAAESFVEATRS